MIYEIHKNNTAVIMLTERELQHLKELLSNERAVAYQMATVTVDSFPLTSFRLRLRELVNQQV